MGDKYLKALEANEEIVAKNVTEPIFLGSVGLESGTFKP